MTNAAEPNLVENPSVVSTANNMRIIKSHVDRLFRHALDRSGVTRENPVTREQWLNGVDPVARQKRDAHRALLAREWFYVYGPPDAPPLPLSDWEIDDLRWRVPFNHLVAHFAVSLGSEDYDFNIHPSFEDYARSVLASDHAPDFLKNDEALCKRYPPRDLCTIGPGLLWKPPEVTENNRRSMARRR